MFFLWTHQCELFTTSLNLEYIYITLRFKEPSARHPAAIFCHQEYTLADKLMVMIVVLMIHQAWLIYEECAVSLKFFFVISK